MVCLSSEYCTKDICRMAKIQDKVMNMKKVVKQLPCEEGLSRLRLFSLVRDYKRENTIEVSHHRQGIRKES